MEFREVYNYHIIGVIKIIQVLGSITYLKIDKEVDYDYYLKI